MADYGAGLWLVEDKGTWVGDPFTLDTTDFGDSGDDHWVCEYAEVEHSGAYTGDYENIPGWTFINVSFEEGNDLIKVVGTYQGADFNATKAKENELHEFFRKHSDLGDSIFYMVKCWSSHVFSIYSDEDRADQEYMPVVFMAVPKTKIGERILKFSFILRSAWGV